MTLKLFKLVDGADMSNLSTNDARIVCTTHPEWGSFGVIGLHNDLYIIHGRTGHRTLSKLEAAKHWSLVDNKIGIYFNAETNEYRELAHDTYCKWISTGNKRAQEWEPMTIDQLLLMPTQV